MSTDANGAESHSHGGVAPHARARSPRARARLALPDLPEAVDIFDTILRDGSQQEGLSLTVDDKLRVAEQLDHLGVTYIEGGWPGANPKDVEFFARAKKELTLGTATLVAFGSTRRAGVSQSTTPSWPTWWRPERPSPASSPSRGTATWPRRCARRSTRPWRWWPTRCATCGNTTSVSFSMRSISSTAIAATPTSRSRSWPRQKRQGADALVLCDTNGGTLPDDVGQAVADVRARTSAQLGIHCHNDAGCAVANSLVAVQAGATQVQGCINGYGERAGNTDLSAAIPNLSLKLNVRTIPADRLERLTPVAHHIAELVNIAPNPQQPYVGNSVFAHKGGLHASAVARSADLYEHVDPNLVGNGTRVVVSEMAGRSTLAMKAAELGLELDGEVLGRVLDELKRLEHEGYHFEVADGSLELLLRRATGWVADYFTVESFRVITDHGERSDVKGGRRPPRPSSDARRHDRGDGQGPRGTRAHRRRGRGQRTRSTRSTAPCGAPSAPSSPRWTTST